VVITNYLLLQLCKKILLAKVFACCTIKVAAIKLTKGLAMKILKMWLVMVVVLCLATVFFASTIYAVGNNNCCIAECFCVDCSCVDDCLCQKDCDCLEPKCFVCEAIVKRREMPETPIMGDMPCINNMCLLSTKIASRFDIYQVCTASIIEDKVRMNN